MAGSAAGLCQLQQVVGGADQRPFASDLIEPSHQELSEASGLLDLPEHRLDHLLPEAIAAAAVSPLQAGGHRAHQGHLGHLPAAGRVCLAMTRPARSKVARDAPLLQRDEVRLVGKAGVARDLPRLAPEMSPDPVHRRHERAVIGRVGHEPVRDDHLMGGIMGDAASTACQRAPKSGSPSLRVVEWDDRELSGVASIRMG